MKFNLGDFVRFVDEKREGYITRIIDALTVGVTDTDGFEIPVAVSNLTTVYGHQAHPVQTEEVRMDRAAAIPSSAFIGEGLFLAVSEVQKNNPTVHFHFINRSSYELLVSLTTADQEAHQGQFGGVIPAQGQSQVFTANLAELDRWPALFIQAIFFTRRAMQPKTPLLWNRKFKSKHFSEGKERINELNQYGWIFRLDEPVPLIDPQKLKESLFRGEERSTKVGRPAEEIDLHIEKLRDDHQFLNATEMLTAQLDHFQSMLAAGIVHEFPKMVFIHGVGNGTLRHQIHKVLSKHPQVRTFMDAQKLKFGFGATEVIFKTT